MTHTPEDYVMSPEEFRAAAHEMVDWMADYMHDVHRMHVVPTIDPGHVKHRLPETPPDRGESWETIFDDFKKIIVPGMTHWNHPGWFAYFPANNSPASILAEMATATFGSQCMSWATSPAATELEQVTMEWLRKMLGLPDDFTGVIQDTASTATLVAMLTARERATGFTFNEKGAAAEGADKLCVYASNQAHSSVEKAVKLAGLGLERFRQIAVDENFAIIPEELEKAIEADIAAGLKPCAVVGVTGSTSSTAIDPLRTIGEICQKYDIWFHVDAAYAGAAALLAEKRKIIDGVGYADSFVFNPHKWLFTNFDCSAYFVRDKEALLKTFALTPEYLKTLHDDNVVNFRDWGIQLGRRFRALKLWFVIRSFGVDGLKAKIRDHIAFANSFRMWVEESPLFDLMAPAPLGLVCFRFKPDGVTDEKKIDELNAKLLQDVNSTGKIHITHSVLNGKYVMRFCVGQLWTKRADVEDAWELIEEKAEAL